MCCIVLALGVRLADVTSLSVRASLIIDVPAAVVMSWISGFVPEIFVYLIVLVTLDWSASPDSVGPVCLVYEFSSWGSGQSRVHEVVDPRCDYPSCWPPRLIFQSLGPPSGLVCLDVP